jgi:2-oxoglutarate dehydrogenase E2 component (dihydrolipoamide succinyltransferase)
MPALGESIMECTVLTLLNKEGDSVRADDSVLEVATDKVDTEVPSPYSGVLVAWLVKEGDVVAIGSPVARLQVEENPDSDDKHPTDGTEDFDAVAFLEKDIHNAVRKTSDAVAAEILLKSGSESSTFYSPLVLSIAREENLSAQELASIQGTGAENRVTKNDIISFLSERIQTKNEPAPVQAPVKAVSLNGASEIIEMDRIRKMISSRMSESKRISAHVTSFIEADMTAITKWRESVKHDFRKKSGDSITFTPILIEAVVKAIKDYPLINISVEGDNIIKKKDINIGMAVALPDGNLIVPVIHHADQYDLAGLARKVNELAKRARENKLKADDLAGGTYTISNIGAFGNLMGTPIIVQPQVAIMAFGAIKKKPAVIETSQGDLIGIRSLMFISHSYDHRVVDGSLGGMFVKRVSDYLENFDIHRTLV